MVYCYSLISLYINCFILQDSLGGNAKTYIIGCVHPSSRCFGDTLSTLQFAARAKMIKNNVSVYSDLWLQYQIQNFSYLYSEGNVSVCCICHSSNRGQQNKYLT